MSTYCVPGRLRPMNKSLLSASVSLEGINKCECNGENLSRESKSVQDEGVQFYIGGRGRDSLTEVVFK